MKYYDYNIFNCWMSLPRKWKSSFFDAFWIPAFAGMTKVSDKNKMRLYSTPESAEKREFSILAIIETVIAVSLSIFIVHQYDTISHIIAATLIAPFLLLRTQASTELGLKWFEKVIDFLEGLFYKYCESKDNLFRKENISLLFIKIFSTVIFFISAMGIFAIAVKVYATVIITIKEPIKSIKRIPFNWTRIALSTDTMHPPEVIPGVELTNSLYEFRFSQHLYSIFNSVKRNLLKDKIVYAKNKMVYIVVRTRVSSIALTIIVFVIALIDTLLLYLPSIIYRFSLKSSSLIYLPFIWIIKQEEKNEKQGKELEITVDNILNAQLERVKITYAFVVIFFFTAIPLYFSFHYDELLDLGVIAQFFMPITEINSWHISRFGSAAVTLFLFFYADNLKIRLQHDDNFQQEKAIFNITAIKRLRFIFSAWTLLCAFYILLTHGNSSLLPNIRWFPW